MNFAVLINLGVLLNKTKACDFLNQSWRFCFLQQPVAGLCAATGTSSGRSSEAEGRSAGTFNSKIKGCLVLFFSVLRGCDFFF